MTEGARDFRGKGRAFRGIFGGESYRRLAALFGFQERFYRRAVGDLRLGEGGRALDLGGNTLAEFRLDSADVESDPAGTLRLLGRSAAAMATNLRATGTEVIGARLAIPGLLNAHDQRLLVAPNLGWSDLDPLAMLGREWDALGIPTLTRNDADLQSLTAAYQRPGKLLADGAFLYIFGDVGVGGAIMDRGAPIRGAHGWAGEVGHTTVHADGLACKCGSRGCLEAYASATGLINMTREAMAAHPESLMNALAEREGRVGGHTAFAAAERGDAAALRVVDEYVDYLACGVTNIVNGLQPEVVGIGGGVGRQGDRLLAPLRQKVYAEVYGGRGERFTRLTQCTLGYRAGLVGAAMAAMQSTGEAPAVCS